MFKHVPAIPEKALVIYNSGHISHHHIHHQGSNFALGAGSLLNKQSLSRVLNMARKKGEVKEEGLTLLPPELVINSPKTVAWVKEPVSFSMWYKNMSISSCPLPRLLFVVNEGNMLVFALKSTRQSLSDDTALFHAPLMNINKRGSLCFGSAIKPSQLNIDGLLLWEDALLASQFTHVNHPHTLRIPARGQGDITTLDQLRFWRNLSTQARFPSSALYKTGITMGALMETLL